VIQTCVDYDVYDNEYYQLSSSIKKCTAKLTVNGWHQKPTHTVQA